MDLDFLETPYKRDEFTRRMRLREGMSITIRDALWDLMLPRPTMKHRRIARGLYKALEGVVAYNRFNPSLDNYKRVYEAYRHGMVK